MIFYFSATGNSKYVAQCIAEKTGEAMISITDCLKESDFSFSIAEGERIGFITPVYHWGLPTVVVEFVAKLQLAISGNPYIYHVITYGTTTGEAHKLMAAALKSQKLALGGKFIVQMPDTWTPVFDLSDMEQVQATLSKGRIDANAVVDLVINRRIGDYNNRKIPFARLYYLHYKNGGKTEKFTVDATCVNCGLCEKKCPSSAIEIQGGKPVWVKARCTQCLGCLHRCPKFSIQYGKKTKAHGQYVNLNVTL